VLELGRDFWQFKHLFDEPSNALQIEFGQACDRYPGDRGGGERRALLSSSCEHLNTEEKRGACPGGE